MKVTQMNSSKNGDQKFLIRHSDGVKTMEAVCYTCPVNNDSSWQFKHQNGMRKNFKTFDAGIDFYEKKGW